MNLIEAIILYGSIIGNILAFIMCWIIHKGTKGQLHGR